MQHKHNKLFFDLQFKSHMFVFDDWVHGLTFEIKRNRWNALSPPPLT